MKKYCFNLIQCNGKTVMYKKPRLTDGLIIAKHPKIVVFVKIITNL